MSLLVRLLLLVAIALTPSLAIQGWDGFQRHRELARASRDAALAQTQALQGDMVRAAEGVRQLLVALSEVPSIKDGDARACTAYLRSVGGRFGEYQLLGVTDASGEILCSSSGVAPGAYSNAGRAYFRRAMASGAFAAGDLVTGLSTHRPSVHFALPVARTDGTAAGIVLASIDQERLAAQVAQSSPAPGSVALVVDPSGTVVAEAKDGRVQADGWTGKPIPADLRAALATPKPKLVGATGSDGRTLLFGILPPDPRLGGLTVAVGVDQALALSDLHGQTRSSLLGLALGAVLAMAAATVGARRFVVAPLLRISAAAERVGKGDLGARAELGRRGGEVREVGAAFDRMSTALAERESARERAEGARRASEGRYRTLFDAIEAGFCIVEVRFEGGGPVDYRFLEVNPAFVGQTGLHDAVGRWMRDIAPGHEQHWFDLYGRVASTGEPIRFENEGKALGRWYDVHAFRVDRPEDGHVAILFNDITDRRRMEVDLRDLNAGLERRIAEAVEERGRVEEALRQSQKLEAVGQLTGGVAHDFNNLLTILRSSVDLLRKPGLADDRRRRYLDAISDTVDRAAKLTSQLLSFARRQALAPDTFDAAARLRSIGDMLDSVTGARIRVVFDVARKGCHVRADASQFETAVVNMAVNARDAMGGEGTLTLGVAVRAGLPPIRGHAGSAGDFVAVTLTDTGVGIAAEQVTHIFEPFFTTKGVGEGTGLGLSQVFGFAKQSGGDIGVASEPGRGTTFTLYLPRVAAAAAAVAGADDGGPAVDGEARRVLVVEDNVEIGRFALQILEDLGYCAEWATDAAEALSRLDGDGAFDVVFSDVVMPGEMDGVALACEIRRRRPGLPVVLTSGYSHVLAREGPHGFDLVHKPYSAGQLARALGHAVAVAAGQPPETAARNTEA
ncbi:ATP-binding protein [Lichenibacterium dinghuense]|uniref:ATP-binding protein n=1 Tax=Lichenibacterium dinghuense TaxID=2895977 RepID=UPI001F1EA838|nr:ATP-binding protein [Lichenibacterium sp. 6Y81]